MINQNQEKSKVIILAIIISFLVGGVSGGVIGLLSSSFFATSNNTSETIINKQINLEENSATIDVVDKVSPSVVSIVITKDLSQLYNLTGPDIFPFEQFFPYQYQVPEGQTEIGGGTGFIVDASGLIITNRHVVSDTEAEYTVVTNDGNRHDATILGTDPFNDIAIVKIEASDLKPVEFSDSDQIKIGQTVIAIGNTLAEYRNTVTRGVVSGINRTITAGDSSGSSEVIEEAIQTDAAINLGNSGGPLLNLEGQVIGINTAIDQEGESIAFAIPINDAKPVIESVKKYGKIVRPMLGIRYRAITTELAEANNLPVDYGALLVPGDSADQLAVLPGGPADKAGLVENDIILEMGGQKIDSEHTIAREISRYQVGDSVTLKVWHDGKEKVVNITLEEYNMSE